MSVLVGVVTLGLCVYFFQKGNQEAGLITFVAGCIIAILLTGV